ncbi:hypothetical protein GDO78_009021 [Eleutherodactylus coqui]|uniref:Uncharacterized protein n=1 Tax=Eleutherodactylus coqui TaxID=57060 RepID=A0A8J6KBJ6_ELECQ|nr:hypothetical protein GDO78_009021 [Eleutherodactylus coqui]
MAAAHLMFSECSRHPLLRGMTSLPGHYQCPLPHRRSMALCGERCRYSMPSYHRTQQKKYFLFIEIGGAPVYSIL